MDLWKIALSSVGSIIVLFLLTKLMGNKQMSQLSMFDYINGITIGSIAAEMATSLEDDFWKPLLAMTIYAVTSFLISIFTCKSIKMRRFMNGRAIVLFEGGKLYNKNLLRAKIDIDDLLTQCRNNGYFNLAEIQSAILETNGIISFLPKSDIRPVNVSDMQIDAEQEKPVANVIMDGKVLEGNLKYTGNNLEWLHKQLKSQGVKKIQEVFLATCNSNNQLSVYVKIDKPMKRNIFN